MFFMAENKKSFVLYSDSQGLINQLPDEVAGQLLKHIFAYVNDENPQTDNLLLKIAFEPIKMQLKRDLVKYEDKKEQWSEAGKKSAEARRLKKEQELLLLNNYSTDSTNVNSVATVSTVNVNVNDSVNVNVTSTEVIKFEDAVKICLFDDAWADDVERVYKIDKAKIQYALTDFRNHCGTIGENKDKSLNNFKKHFTNWVRIKKQYAKN